MTNFSIVFQVFIILEQKDARNPGNIHMFKVNKENTRKRCKICLKLAIRTPERRHCLY